jgi:glycosyltransferase involved in cell wall biosynthesis
MTPPLISIIIPALNAERFIAEAIESILAQNVAQIEIVVIDDGSTDGTAAIASRYGPQVWCISQTNRGLPGARNRGLAAATGDLIGFCDADDVFMPGCLQLQLYKLTANPDKDLVVGRFVNETMVSGPGEAMAFAPLVNKDDYILSMSVSLVRRHVFEEVGQFNETMRQCDDWDWFMRAREAQVPILFHPTQIMRRRLHDGNMTRDQVASRRYTALMLKQSLDRRRRGGLAAKSLASLASQDERTGGQKETS